MTRLLIAALLLGCTLPLFAQAPTKSGTAPAAPKTTAAPGKAVQYPVRPASDAQPAAGQVVQPIGPPLPGQAMQPPVIPATPQPPEWTATMTPAEEKWIDEILQFWEARSNKVKLFECKFQRWDYDGGYVDANQKRQPRTYAEGTIKYAQPDKGLYHVQKLVSVMPPAQAGGPPQNVPQNPELGEHWICDGQKVLSFEASKKQVTETPLPPEMRGKAIADGPLPFMFGAKAVTIKARYWIHGLQPNPGNNAMQNKYWLEAVPKSREDSQNFKQVRIVLDQAEYLPESIEIFAPNYDPPRNDARQSYVFSERVAKDGATIDDMVKKGLDPFGLFHRDFFNPAIPVGWKKVVQGGGMAAAPPPQQATLPPQQLGPAPPRPAAISR